MTEKKSPESPFAKAHLEFKEGTPNRSFPAVRPDDKRLTDGRGSRLLRGNVPGVNGNFKKKPLADALRKKMEEKAAAEGKTLAEFWADLVLNGAEGKVNMTPSQRACIEIIRDTIEGKPGTAQEDESDQTMIVLDEVVAE
jgi:hypothetical protein